MIFVKVTKRYSPYLCTRSLIERMLCVTYGISTEGIDDVDVECLEEGRVGMVNNLEWVVMHFSSVAVKVVWEKYRSFIPGAGAGAGVVRCDGKQTLSRIDVLLDSRSCGWGAYGGWSCCGMYTFWLAGAMASAAGFGGKAWWGLESKCHLMSFATFCGCGCGGRPDDCGYSCSWYVWVYSEKGKYCCRFLFL